ncbi:MAG: hypothetical protein ACMUHB_00625 [Thermoplasmatota archaeon]
MDTVWKKDWPKKIFIVSSLLIIVFLPLSIFLFFFHLLIGTLFLMPAMTGFIIIFVFWVNYLGVYPQYIIFDMTDNQIVSVYNRLYSKYKRPVSVGISARKVSFHFYDDMFSQSYFEYIPKERKITTNSMFTDAKCSVEEALRNPPTGITAGMDIDRFLDNIRSGIDPTLYPELVYPGPEGLRWKRSFAGELVTWTVASSIIGFGVWLALMLTFFFGFSIEVIKVAITASGALASVAMVVLLVLLTKGRIKDRSFSPERYAVTGEGVYLNFKICPYYSLLKWKDINNITRIPMTPLVFIYPGPSHRPDAYLRKFQNDVKCYYFMMWGEELRRIKKKTHYYPL